MLHTSLINYFFTGLFRARPSRPRPPLPLPSLSHSSSSGGTILWRRRGRCRCLRRRKSTGMPGDTRPTYRATAGACGGGRRQRGKKVCIRNLVGNLINIECIMVHINLCQFHVLTAYFLSTSKFHEEQNNTHSSIVIRTCFWQFELVVFCST